MEKYENDVISQFHIIFTFLSYYCHICTTFLGSGPRSGPQKSYFCNIPGHIFSYYFHMFVYAWAGAPVHSAIFDTLVWTWKKKDGRDWRLGWAGAGWEGAKGWIDIHQNTRKCIQTHRKRNKALKTFFSLFWHIRWLFFHIFHIFAPGTQAEA